MIEQDVADALHRMIRVACRNHTVIEGTVVPGSVDKTNYWCDVLVDDGVSSVTFVEVPLKVLTGSAASLIEFPADGSPVLMKFRDGNQDRPQIDKIQIVDTVIINPGTLTQFNQGSNGGLVLVNPLTEKLNNLENLVNDLVDKFNAHTHNVTAVGSPTGPNLDPETTVLTPTVAADIENENVTQ